MFDVIVHLEKVTSTMDIAREMSFWLSPPFLVISDTQTGGYGQYNRKWFSPEGGLWFTEVLNLKNYTAISLLMSILIVRVLKRYIPKRIVKIKWPNDVYVDGKKVAGILTKLSGSLAFIGIGVNVENNIDYSIADIATSLSYFTKIERLQLFRELLREEDSLINCYKQSGFKPFVKEYNEHLIFLNKQIVVKSKRVVQGEAVGVNQDGNLLVKEGSSHIEKVSSGTVIKF